MGRASALIELNRAFPRAELTGDVEFFTCYLSDGLRFRRANGTVVDKATFLNELGAPGNRNDRIEGHQIEVLEYGEDLAVCSMVVDFKGQRGGAAVEGRFRNRAVSALTGAQHAGLPGERIGITRRYR